MVLLRERFMQNITVHGVDICCVWIFELKNLELLYKLHSFLFLRGSADKESTCNVGDMGLIPGLERSPGEGIGHPL